MLTRLISGGQTGADRSALDVALELGISCGGYCPRQRWAEDGPLDARYPLEETDSDDPAVRTEMNVRAADGTLVLLHGPADAGTELTLENARQWNRPCLVIDLATESASTGEVISWLEQNRIKVLNVAGPRESSSPGLYDQVRPFMRELLEKCLQEKAEGK